jgi:hypothetical protein
MDRFVTKSSLSSPGCDKPGIGAADRDQQITGRSGLLTGVAVRFLSQVTELVHLTQHRDPASRRARQELEQPLYRQGRRVVAVVDQRNAVADGDDAPAVLWRHELGRGYGHLLGPHAKGRGRRRGSEQVLGLVLSRQV